MASEGEEEIRKALEDVLEMYDIKLDPTPKGESEQEHDERITDYSEIIDKTQESIDELSMKSEDILKRTGMNRDELEAYATNPNNFTPEQWKLLENVKQACEKYRRDAINRIGPERLAKAEEAEKSVGKKELKKGKGRFAKKKQWIPL